MRDRRLTKSDYLNRLSFDIESHSEHEEGAVTKDGAVIAAVELYCCLIRSGAGGGGVPGPGGEGMTLEEILDNPDHPVWQNIRKIVEILRDM
jgi:hypothetical protein